MSVYNTLVKPIFGRKLSLVSQNMLNDYFSFDQTSYKVSDMSMPRVTLVILSTLHHSATVFINKNSLVFIFIPNLKFQPIYHLYCIEDRANIAASCKFYN